MKAAAVAAIVLFFAIAIAIAGDAVAQPRPALVSVAVTTASVRDGVETRVDSLLIWNRNIRTTPIGSGIKWCIKVDYNRTLAGCTIILSLPKGKVAAAGIVHNYGRYTFVLTGGTGVYVGVRGPLFVTRIADGVRRFTFTVR